MRERRRGDPLGLVGFGVFLIVVAMVFIIYPEIPSEFIIWIRSWRTGPTMLPMSLVWPLIWFLSALGVWNLISAGIRVVTRMKRREGVSDAFGGLFMLVAAFLLREYASGLLSQGVLLPALIITLGALIVIGSMTSYLWFSRKL